MTNSDIMKLLREHLPHAYFNSPLAGLRFGLAVLASSSTASDTEMHICGECDRQFKTGESTASVSASKCKPHGLLSCAECDPAFVSVSEPDNSQVVTKAQRIAIEAAISISEDIEKEQHDGSFLNEASVQALRSLLNDNSQAVALSAREALESIWRYGADTLSGRVDGPDDRAWQRGAVLEMTARARIALDDLSTPASKEPK